MAGIWSIGVLPEDCVSEILSLTTPSDVGKLSLVSSGFRRAAESDVVWGRFLPKNYGEIVAASEMWGEECGLRSKREIFFRMCSPILMDGGKKSLELERFRGKISYTLSARELDITWSSDPLCWTWKSHPKSRFPEVAELRTVSWLEIHGKIRTQVLSPNTKYGAYLLVKISERAYGLDLMPAQVCVQLGNNTNTNTNNVVCTKSSVWLHHKDHHKKLQNLECLFYGNRRERARKLMLEHNNNEEEDEEIRVLRPRVEDDWLEIELGVFFNGENDEELHMSFMETKGFQLKSGLIVHALQIRPISS